VPAESAADRAAFVETDEFGTLAVFTIGGDPSDPVAGILDMQDDNLPFSEAGVVSATPTFTCPSAALPAGVGEDTALTVDGTEYRVAAPIRRDGTGMSVLTLEETG
jgi:hypothetical protein